MAKEEYEHSSLVKHGTKEYVTHLTGKHRKAKSEALKKKIKHLKVHPVHYGEDKEEGF